jgi:glutaredoxin
MRQHLSKLTPSLFRSTSKKELPVSHATRYELVMYSRTMGCPFITIARRVLEEQGVTYREIMIDRDSQARDRVLAWTGFLSVPTLVAAQWEDDLPYSEPAPLPHGLSPRGIHRGALITEPNARELMTWLGDHGFVASE